MRSYRSFLALATVTLLTGAAHAQNLLVNPGFETGNLTGYTIGGNSINFGVAADGTAIAGEESPFIPAFVNVRSGSFAGFAVIRTFPLERITLTQTVNVLPGSIVDVGFFLGNDSASAFGMNIENTQTQIFVDGVGILANSSVTVQTGSGPGNFVPVQGSFATGARTSVTVTFAITGSGSSRAGASFDDLFVTPRTSVTAAPEPGTITLLAAGLLPLAGVVIRKRRKAAL